MKTLSKSFAAVKKSGVAAAALALLPAGAASAAVHPAHSSALAQEQNQLPQGKFFCNVNALTQQQRIHHVKLTEKLLAVRGDAVPLEKGYELQYDPNKISLAELADWVNNESKCCPFFDFHIDLENDGLLLCIRLTGPQGINPFIESEFHLR